MQFRMRWSLAAAVLLGLVTLVAAQTAPRPAAKAVAWKSYCHPTHSFCFKYPATWSILGEVFDGYGVVVAPQQKQARELWDEVTVALVIPPPEGDEEPVTVAEAIAQAVSSVRKSGQDFETLQRQQRTVNDKPAELVKLHYTEQATGHEWVEELVFIEGPDSEIYSVALKTAPATLPTMEPLFQRMVESWKLPEAVPPPGAMEEGATKAKTGPAAPAKSAAPEPSNPPKM